MPNEPEFELCLENEAHCQVNIKLLLFPLCKSPVLLSKYMMIILANVRIVISMMCSINANISTLVPKSLRFSKHSIGSFDQQCYIQS